MHRQMKIIVCMLLYLMGVAFADECPQLSAIENFEVSSFTGTWYQQCVLNSLLWQTVGSCVKAEIDVDEDTGILSLGYSQRTSYGGLQSIEGIGVVADSSSSQGVFDLTIATIFGDRTSRVSVLATDYESYAIVYTCREVMSVPYETAWVFSRLKTLDQDTNELINEALQDIAESGGPAQDRFTPIPQDDCF